MTVINTNVKSLIAQDAITKNSHTLSTAMERLSTGMRINRAADDAAGLAISSRMDSQIRGLTQAIRNANDGISIVQTSEGALDEVTNMLQRMRELAVQSGNDSNNSSDRVAMQSEVDQLKKEIDRIASTTQFNSMNLLDGTFQKKQLQIGDKANQTMGIDIQSAKAADLGKASNDTNDRTLISARINLNGVSTWADSQIKINDVGLSAHAATDDIEAVILDINGKNLGVKASGFNVVVADTVGTGVTAKGALTIKVTPPGAAETTYAISASNSLAELVDNINKEAGGAVQASINKDGKLVLSNETGATIKVADSGTIKQSGFTASAERTYQGFLKLESTDGNPIRIEQGTLDSSVQTGGGTSNTTLNALSYLGFSSNVRNNTTDGYTVRGAAITTPTTAWADGDLKINGVNIYSQQVDTTSLQGKVDAINAFTAATGVKASSYAQQTFTTATTGALAVFTSGETVKINGVQSTVTFDASGVDSFIAAVNKISSSTNVVAEKFGTNVRITGRDTNQVSIQFVKADGTNSAGSKLGVVDQSTGVVTATVATTAAPITIAAGIQLDSEINKPISIQLSANADSNAKAVQSASQAAGGNATAFGFLEQNVGAADFDNNVSTLNPFGSQALSRIDITTTSGASNALGVIDNAIRQVNESRSYLGAVQNRLDKTVNNLTNIVTNTQQSRSRIQDADYGLETAQLAKAQIIQQAATAMLAQANQAPQTVLSLLK